MPLRSGELRAAWDEVRRQSPSAFITPPSDVFAWHAEVARTCESNSHWSAALSHLERLTAHELGRPDLFTRKGRACAELGLWDGASTAFERATTLSPDRAGSWYRHALVRLHLGDRDGYRRICTEMLARFEPAKDLGAVQLSAWTGVPAVCAEADGARLVAAAERPVADIPQDHARLLTLGAALYRAGRYGEAVRKLDEAVKVWGNPDTPWDWLFLAMAHQRLGQTDLAKTHFDRAARWIDQRLSKCPGGTSTGALFWSDRLELSLLRREAEAVMSKQVP